MFAVVRVRGTIGLRKDVADTLKMLRLSRPNHCILLEENDVNKGMLKKAHNFITWGEVDPKTLEKLVETRARTKGNKPIEKSKIKEYVGEITNSKSLKVKDLVPVLRLSPPQKGYKKTKMHYPKGALGYRKEKINELLLRMM